ncbi:MAG: tetratricopeptide repeat protein, partial [Acidimicrobiales bacterium]
MLDNAVRSSVVNNRAQLVLLVGDAGVGTTRLALEVAKRVSTEHGALAVEGRCVPYGEANVWWPVAEALRTACLVDLNAPMEEAREATLIRVARAFRAPAPTPEIEQVTTGLLHLMGYDSNLREIDPSNAREEAARSVVAFVEAATDNQPVVLQLSDLHWADDLVLELVDTMLERLARRPFVLVATARQSIRERWIPKPGRYNTLIVNVDPLEAIAAGELLTSLLGAAPPDDLRHALLERSGGNPFFLEELVALLGGRAATATAASVAGLGDLLQLPETLRGLVAARLDGLGPHERAVLTDAAVMGRRGAIEHLRRMSDAMGRTIDVDVAVAELVGRELFEIDGGMWAFRSDLVREVAYGTLTKSDRASRHAGIADWVESHYSGEPSDAVVDRLAHHYGMAAELIVELGQVDKVPVDIRERALHWISEAAERARQGEVLPVAIRLYTQALDLIGEEPSARRLALLLGRSHVRAEGWDTDGARADAEQALDGARVLDDQSCAARSLLGLGDVAQKEGDMDQSIRTLEQAAAMFAEQGDEQGRAEALRMQGMAELFRGSIDAARVAVGSALDAFRRVGSRRGEAWALQNLAWIAFTTGQTDEAEERLEQSVTTFSEIGDVGGKGWALGLLGFVKFQQGRRSEAEALATTILDEARVRGDRWATGMMLVLLGSLRLWEGRTEDAVRLSAEAVDIFGVLGDPYGQSQAFAPNARALIMVGRIDDGFRAFDEALEWAGHMPSGEAAGLARAAYSGACVQLGEPERAVDLGLLAEGDEFASGTIFFSDWMSTLGLARLQQGRVGEAVDLLQRAVDASGEAGARPFVLSALALGLAADGRSAEAVATAEQVPALAPATYSDVLTAEQASALALAAKGDGDAARAVLRRSRQRADATEDRLAQAITRLAESIALAALGDPTADQVAAEAQDRLDRLGTTASGWRCAFALAAGAGATTAGA